MDFEKWEKKESSYRCSVWYEEVTEYQHESGGHCWISSLSLRPVGVKVSALQHES